MHAHASCIISLRSKASLHLAKGGLARQGAPQGSKRAAAEQHMQPHAAARALRAYHAQQLQLRRAGEVGAAARVDVDARDLHQTHRARHLAHGPTLTVKHIVAQMKTLQNSHEAKCHLAELVLWVLPHIDVHSRNVHQPQRAWHLADGLCLSPKGGYTLYWTSVSECVLTVPSHLTHNQFAQFHVSIPQAGRFRHPAC